MFFLLARQGVIGIPCWVRSCVGGQILFFAPTSWYVALMARPLRIQFPGALYHITSRGNAQAAIFLDDRGGIFLGREPFVKEMKDLFRQTEATGEIPRRQRYAVRPSLSELFGEGLVHVFINTVT